MTPLVYYYNSKYMIDKLRIINLMLNNVSLAQCHDCAKRSYPIVGITNSGSLRIPDGQRVVIVLSRV